MANVLITGAAGFVGSQIAHDFHLAGDTLVLVDNFSYGFEDNLIFDDCSMEGWVHHIDIRDTAALEPFFADGIDYVYHNAAITPLPDCQSDPAEAYSVNVAGTAGLLELSRKYGVKRFIFASTSAVYENVTEFPCKDVFEVTPPPSLIYSNSKVAGERLCKSFSDCYGLPATVLRYANVYGPRMDCLRDQPPVVAYLIRELNAGRTPALHSNGEQSRDFIYCDDLSSLAWRVRDCAQPFDVVNVSSATAISINDMYREIARQMGVDVRDVTYESDRHFWGKYPALFEGALPIRDEIVGHEVNKHTLCDNTHAREAYGWVPETTLEEGISRCIAYIVPKLNAAAR